jgi:hypothetical protein
MMQPSLLRIRQIRLHTVGHPRNCFSLYPGLKSMLCMVGLSWNARRRLLVFAPHRTQKLTHQTRSSLGLLTCFPRRAPSFILRKTKHYGFTKAPIIPASLENCRVHAHAVVFKPTKKILGLTGLPSHLRHSSNPHCSQRRAPRIRISKSSPRQKRISPSKCRNMKHINTSPLCV